MSRLGHFSKIHEGLPPFSGRAQAEQEPLEVDHESHDKKKGLEIATGQELTRFAPVHRTCFAPLGYCCIFTAVASATEKASIQGTKTTPQACCGHPSATGERPTTILEGHHSRPFYAKARLVMSGWSSQKQCRDNTGGQRNPRAVENHKVVGTRRRTRKTPTSSPPTTVSL